MNKLAQYIIIAAITAAVGFLMWYFRSILVYIIVSAVIAMIGRPVVRKITALQIGKFRIPPYIAAVMTLALILGLALSLSMLISPFISKISNLLAGLNTEALSGMEVLNKINDFIVRIFPALTPEFRVEDVVADKLRELATVGNVSGVLTSVVSILSDAFVAVFSICFISFFFLSKEGTFTNIIVAVMPDKYEENIRRSSKSITNLLSRYFAGILFESLGVATINLVGLVFIAKMEPSFAILLACISGILNVVPYVGPLIGHIVAFSSSFLVFTASSFGGQILVFAGVVLAIFLFTQLVDNYLFQPLIYSSSVKAHPLEIFIVILMGGHIGGMVGMLIAIPTYTVMRVVAGEFLPNLKFVQQITKGINK
jgi:predicted PurR-regulated permease PerM